MSQERVMLLIDADNLSLDVMEQAVRLLLNQHGGLHVRRAYCTAESAVANQAAFKRLGIKPMVNLAAGKNSTDIAMAVDAIDLVLAERPDVVVIASSDSDFAPLVQRLREKGCVVRGIGQKGKVGDETQDVYDDYTVIEHRGGAASKAPARSAAKSVSAPRAGRVRAPKATQAPAPAPAVQAAAAPVAKAAKSRRAAGGRASAKPALQDDVFVPPQTTDTRDIFEAIVEGALDVEAAVVDEKPAAKTSRRARKSATGHVQADSVVVGVVDLVDDVVADVGAAVATPTPARSRRRKPKAAEAVPEVAAALEDAASVPTPARQHTAAAEDPPGTAAPRATLQAVMACLPELARGQALPLNVAVQRLREARLLGKNSSSLKLFSQLSDTFELLPARNPSQVRLRG